MYNTNNLYIFKIIAKNCINIIIDMWYNIYKCLQ